MAKTFIASHELGNTWTHLIGTLFALSCIWSVWPAVDKGWQWAFGIIFFISGMFLMFLSSTIYHWVPQGKAKQVMRKLDHISIYVMIACSYTPICVAVIGGWLGWTIFGIQWGLVIGGVFYKVFAINRFPRLSLAIYLTMGWSGLLIAKPLILSLSAPVFWLIIAEGVLYSIGTYFFAHDSHKHFHAVWHVFVLLGAMVHWTAILLTILNY